MCLWRNKLKIFKKVIGYKDVIMRQLGMWLMLFEKKG